MSIPPPDQTMGESPAPNTPSPGPNLLNFTAQVHSLLNGESPASTPSDDNIPGAPVSILETSTQDDNNGAPDEMNVTEAGNTNEDEADTTSGQGGVGLDETFGEAGRPGEDVNTRSVQQFFNLDLEQQTETLIRYQQHLSQVVDQNKQLLLRLTEGALSQILQ